MDAERLVANDHHRRVLLLACIHPADRRGTVSEQSGATQHLVERGCMFWEPLPAHAELVDAVDHVLSGALAEGDHTALQAVPKPFGDLVGPVLDEARRADDLRKKNTFSDKDQNTAGPPEHRSGAEHTHSTPREPCTPRRAAWRAPPRA